MICYAAILAFAAIPFVLRSSGLAKPAVWVFNIFGTLDLLAAITFATIYNAPVTIGTGLLDSRFLGSTIIGYALCDLRSTSSALVVCIDFARC